MNRSDAAIEGIISQLSRYVPNWQEEEWVGKELQTAKLEKIRREKEDQEGMKP